MRVFVVNMGVISALGAGVSANVSCLINKQHGLHNRMAVLNPVSDNFPVGKVELTNNDLQNILEINIELPRTSLLSIFAAREALAGFKNNKARLGFISGTTVGGMDKSESFFKHYIPTTTRPNIRDVIYHSCGSATTQAAKYIANFDYVSTINTACSSSANAIILAARKIRQNQLDAVIAGGSDALCQFTLNGFNSLLILDPELCKPFDQNRKGLNLGEGAGYVLVASEKFVKENNCNIICELAGYGNTNDAYHATASSDNGEGSFLAMQKALQLANVAPKQIDYINLHGTGTQNNDQSEGMAVKRLFKDDYPSLSSTKSYTGHTLGASGGIEAVFSCLAIQKQVAFPSLRFKQAIEGCNISAISQVEYKNVQYVLSNSFGFGGNCSSLLFKQV